MAEKNASDEPNGELEKNEDSKSPDLEFAVPDNSPLATAEKSPLISCASGLAANAKGRSC